MSAGLSLLCALALLAPLPGDLNASPDDAYTVEREFVSPVTGESFVTKVLIKGVKVPSYDYDFCPHPPLNTLAYTIVIDPATGYVAYPESFDKPCAWSREDLKRVLGQPKFKHNAPDGLPWLGAYAWERYENGALLAQEAKRPSSEVADYWLLAAWSVRLDVISGGNEYDAEVARIFKRLPRRSPNPGDMLTLYEMQLAQAWQAMRDEGQLADVPAGDFSLALAWLYRSRGELTAARHYLDAALEADAEQKDNLLYRYLDSSLKLEQDYLNSAAEWLGKAWNDGEIHGPGEAWSAFMLAEISRRMGGLAQAKTWYEQALQVNKGTLNTDMVKHQQKLLDNGLGY
jgi:tetratricopeptide (TPR) repeat protein